MATTEMNFYKMISVYSKKGALQMVHCNAPFYDLFQFVHVRGKEIAILVIPEIDNQQILFSSGDCGVDQLVYIVVFCQNQNRIGNFPSLKRMDGTQFEGSLVHAECVVL